MTGDRDHTAMHVPTASATATPSPVVARTPLTAPSTIVRVPPIGDRQPVR
jgi:hypothetical protein